jgi:hypothetical protein
MSGYHPLKIQYIKRSSKFIHIKVGTLIQELKLPVGTKIFVRNREDKCGYIDINEAKAGDIIHLYATPEKPKTTRKESKNADTVKAKG